MIVENWDNMVIERINERIKYKQGVSEGGMEKWNDMKMKQYCYKINMETERMNEWVEC